MSENTEVQVALQRIYVKDISFESPNAPELFQQQWQPKVNLVSGINKIVWLLKKNEYNN